MALIDFGFGSGDWPRFKLRIPDPDATDRPDAPPAEPDRTAPPPEPPAQRQDER
jgi:hypothetical protein